MMEWETSDHDIESTEILVLPEGAHFAEDARNVIRCWSSTDVAACPGSGKTTVLLAKLKLLADKMPFENGEGICVLSHTNVAVNEIKNRLADYTAKLFGYPNYIGTIQSFVDRFVTMPYLRNIAGRNVQVVDDLTYAQHMLNRMQNSPKYRALDFVTKNNFETGGQFTTRIDHTQALHIRNDGALGVGKQKRALAGAQKASTKQYNELITDLLEYEGIIRYRDAYLYAEIAVNNLPETYADLLPLRFRYIFIDEYQDCDDVQRRVIDSVFNSAKCTVIKIGDSDQAIYNSSENEVTDWVPQDGFLPIMTSCRYSQEIADVICRLKKENLHIVTDAGKTGIKPVLFVFDMNSIEKVLYEFVNVLESHGLYDNKGVYKAIGAVRKESSSGLKIGSYWPEFDGSSKKLGEYNYWALLDNVAACLLDGKLYKAERIVRKILCRVFHYAKVRNPISGKEFSISSIKKVLDDEWRDIYRQWIYELSRLQSIDRENIDYITHQKINELIKTTDELYNVMAQLTMTTEVIEAQTYVYGDKKLHRFTPFKDDVVMDLPSDIDADELDTIVVPAREDGFNEEFLENNRWFAIRISSAMIDKIKYIAAYQVAPVSGITHIAEVERIEKYKDTNKYIVFFKSGTTKKINKISLGKKKGMAPQAPRYSSYNTILTAKTLDDLWD